MKIGNPSAQSCTITSRNIKKSSANLPAEGRRMSFVDDDEIRHFISSIRESEGSDESDSDYFENDFSFDEECTVERVVTSSISAPLEVCQQLPPDRGAGPSSLPKQIETLTPVMDSGVAGSSFSQTEECGQITSRHDENPSKNLPVNGSDVSESDYIESEFSCDVECLPAERVFRQVLPNRGELPSSLHVEKRTHTVLVSSSSTQNKISRQVPPDRGKETPSLPMRRHPQTPVDGSTVVSAGSGQTERSRQITSRNVRKPPAKFPAEGRRMSFVDDDDIRDFIRSVRESEENDESDFEYFESDGPEGSDESESDYFDREFSFDEDCLPLERLVSSSTPMEVLRQVPPNPGTRPLSPHIEKQTHTSVNDRVVVSSGCAQIERSRQVPPADSTRPSSLSVKKRSHTAVKDNGLESAGPKQAKRSRQEPLDTAEGPPSLPVRKRTHTSVKDNGVAGAGPTQTKRSRQIPPDADEDPSSLTNRSERSDRNRTLVKDRDNHSSKTAGVPSQIDSVPVVSELRRSKELANIVWKQGHLQLPLDEVEFRGDLIVPRDLSKLKTPYQCFRYFLGEDILRNIAEETNLYARQKKASNEYNVTATDIRQYIGILAYMSVYRYPNAPEYWGKYSFEPIRQTMSSKKFFSIKQYLHFNNDKNQKPKGHPGFDALHKVRPILDYFNQSFLRVPMLPRLCVDEQMCATKMSSPLRQYMPNKPHKWGFKLFVLCDSSGYAYHFEVFTGADSNVVLPNTPDLGAAANVVVRLSQVIPDSMNHIIYCDNFFTTLALLIYLKSRCILALGTIRANRIHNCPLPNDKQKEIIEKPKGYSLEYVAKAHEVDLSTVLWKDNRNVRLASTYVGVKPFKDAEGSSSQQASRYDRIAKKYVQIDCPPIIHEYNCHMGGVDLMDSLIGRYRIGLKTRKWTLRLFYHLLDVVMVNSYLLHKRINDKTPPLAEFRTEVASVLCGDMSHKRPVGRPTLESIQNLYKAPTLKREYLPANEIRFDGVDHFPIAGDRSEKRKCKMENCKSQTQVYCIKCGVHLCISAKNNCFLLFHVK